MARIGITYIDVENAALQLQGRGKNPTVDSIREILGTGSKSTIAQHLRTWKAEQMPDQAMLPQELLSLVSGLWEKLNAFADERILRIEQETRHEIAQLSQTSNVLQQDLSVIQQQKLGLEEQLMMKERNIEALSNQLADEKQKNQGLLIQQEAQGAQLDEMKRDNERLHQLASHIQANLEHYQAAMQTLQIEQNLIQEKQQTFFQQQLSELDHELKCHRQNAFDLEHALKTNQAETSSLTEALELQRALYATLSQTAQETALALAKNEMHFTHQGQALVATQEELKETKHALQTLMTQHAVMDDHHKRTQMDLQKKDDTLELLRQEKMFLIQENAELKGYLKKIEAKKPSAVHAE